VAGDEIRPYREGDEAPINAAFNQVFGGARTLGAWRWKYRPDGRATPWVMLAVGEDGGVLAHYAAVGVRLLAPEGIVQAGQVVDVFSTPSARAGLAAARTFRETARRFVSDFCRPEGLAFVYGFPGLRHTRLIEQGTGRLGRDEMPAHPVAAWQRRSGGGRWWAGGARVNDRLDAAAADALWQAARPRYHAAVVRDGAFLSWRFAECPGRDYIYVTAGRGRAPGAMAVARLEREAVRVADLLWDGESPRHIASLERALIKVARDAGRSRLELWLDGDAAAAAVLRSLGWEEGTAPGLTVVGYSFHPAITAADLTGRLYVTLADTDLV
jgi:hypothetical protein